MQCTTLIKLHRNYSSTTLQLQLHYTTLNPAVVGEVTTATIATTPTNTNPTTFRSISGFPLPSVIHNNQPLLQVSYSETSTTALCGTTGISLYIYNVLYNIILYTVTIHYSTLVHVFKLTKTIYSYCTRCENWRATQLYNMKNTPLFSVQRSHGVCWKCFIFCG